MLLPQSFELYESSCAHWQAHRLGKPMETPFAPFGARGLYGLLGPIQIMRSWLRKCDEDCGKVAKMVKPAAAATKSKSQILGFVIGTLC